MKKLLSVLLVLCLIIPSAMAGYENESFYTAASVVNCYHSDKAYTDFYNAGDFSVIIPGCGQDFVPQGISYYAPQDLIILSGYSSAGLPSTLMAVDRGSYQVVKQIFLAKPNGELYTGHAGGVCVTDKNIFVSSDNQLYRMSLDTFLNADNACVYNFEESISVPCEAAFCQVNNGVLWVGEFEYAPDHKTDPSHHMKIGNTTNTGWVLGYQLTGSTVNELDPSCLTASGAIPNYIISTTEKIQGFTISNDMIYLSQSYGRTKNSTIYRHTNVLHSVPATHVAVYGAQVPVWFLTEDSHHGKLTAPPMTEGLCTIDGKVYVSFESAASFYRIPTDPENPTPAKNPVDRVFRLDTF